MTCYTDATDTKKITREIERNLQVEDKAIEVLQLIATLCLTTELSEDPMTLWLRLLSENGVTAQKWKGSKDVIEIYPSGTHGVGKSDRLWFQLGETSVAVIKAYESEH
ncbi:MULTISPECIES: hypothetical protein [Acidovorax]|uniref:hypothetical protein n=1 Tax=Acidovorax TaxID=12916 RepID=UPI00023751D8|nr:MULTISPECIES: hypothetical protein [Acidovorax]KRD27168.1 hypothetical protein ASE39_02410 [Acidovorax sp. Root267]KRD48215.1 hypothetical protein ASE52_12625 [Acidovorax sp. Root275]